MSTRTGKLPIDRGTAERILRGDHVAPSAAATDPLARLLAAATAPARPSELLREETAVAAFRTAHRPPVPQPQRRSMIKLAVAKLLTVKVAALAAAVVGVGGVALAATSGTIPSPLHGTAASSHSPADDKARPSGHPSGRPSDQRDPAAVPSGFPPGLYWLCQDYIGRDAEHRGKALGESKFHELVAQAGGQDKDKADKFCDKLLSDGSDAASTDRPSDADDHESKAPAAGHKPSEVADPPTNRPSGLPTPNPSR
jgi:hypothetical protein